MGNADSIPKENTARQVDKPWLDMHTHTTFSDGDLPLKELVSRAKKRGITHLAVTDHLFTHVASVQVVAYDGIQEGSEPESNRIRGDALPDVPFSEYLKKINQVKEKATGMGMHVFAGGELDFLAAEKNYEFLLESINKLDIILVENVHAGNWDAFLKMRELISIPVGLAHVEISVAFPEVPPSMLASEFLKSDVFVEINSASLWRVEALWEAEEHFDEMAVQGVPFSFGTDLHDIHPAPNASVSGWDFVNDRGFHESFEWVRKLGESPELKRQSSIEGLRINYNKLTGEFFEWVWNKSSYAYQVL